MTTEDEWLGADVEAEDGSPEAIAGLLEAIATSLREGPETKRYDIKLEIDEQ